MNQKNGGQKVKVNANVENFEWWLTKVNTALADLGYRLATVEARVAQSEPPENWQEEKRELQRKIRRLSDQLVCAVRETGTERLEKERLQKQIEGAEIHNAEQSREAEYTTDKNAELCAMIELYKMHFGDLPSESVDQLYALGWGA